MLDLSRIQELMGVISVDGRQVGFVTGFRGSDGLLLTSMKEGHGFDHVIPLDWVSDVDRYVFLRKSSAYVVANWETAPPETRKRAQAA
jgi:hypothetical protein